jgi:hypothetical protein
MRKFAAFALGLGLMALAGSAAAQATSADRSVDGSFNVIARGMEAGSFSFHYAQTGGAYDITAQRRLSGLARTLMGNNQDYDYTTPGVVTAAGVLQPHSYQHQGGRRRDDRPNGRVVRTVFTPEDAVTTATPHMGMGSPPATPAQRRGVVDQLTAIASLITATGDPCSRTVRVYLDGRSRFDFVLTPNGRVNVDTPAYRGQALRCSVQFRPIAGFSDPQEAATLTFLFAQTPSGMYAPIRIEMPTDDVGVVRLEARRLSFNGDRLR